MKKKQKVTCIIPTYNGESYIAETIEAVLNQSRKFDEIIVADDGSKDKTVKIAKRYKGIKIVTGPNVERTKNRNRGWKVSTGDIIVFLDSDCIMVKDWLKEMMKGFDQGYKLGVDRRRYRNPQTFIAKMEANFLDRRMVSNYKPFTFWMITRDLLEKYQGFDENMVGPEDIDFVFRIRQGEGNIPIYYNPKAITEHLGEPTTLKGVLRRSFWFGTRIHYYWKKQPTKELIKPCIKGIFLVSIPLALLIKPLLGLGLFVIGYLYVFIRDVLRSVSIKYLFVHPAYMILTEITYYIGVTYARIHKPLGKARPEK